MRYQAAVPAVAAPPPPAAAPQTAAGRRRRLQRQRRAQQQRQQPQQQQQYRRREPASSQTSSWSPAAVQAPAQLPPAVPSTCTAVPGRRGAATGRATRVTAGRSGCGSRCLTARRAPPRSTHASRPVRFPSWRAWKGARTQAGGLAGHQGTRQPRHGSQGGRPSKHAPAQQPSCRFSGPLCPLASLPPSVPIVPTHTHAFLSTHPPCPRPAAGFLNSAATFIPAVAGVDLEGLVKQATGDAAWEPSKPIYRFDSGDDRIEVFLEFS